MSQPALISLLYTTARVHLIPEVLGVWLANVRDVEAVVVTDDEPYDGAVRFADPERCVTVRALGNPGRRDAVSGWNWAARQATGQILVQVSDDLFPPPGWDGEVRQRLDVTRPQVLAISDGMKQDDPRDRLLRHALLTRPYLEATGYLFHPSYQSMFCDREFTDVAYGRGAVVEARDLRFEHRHPRRGRRGSVRQSMDRLDGVGRRHESLSRYRHGQANYRYRKARGFPRDGGLLPPRRPWQWLRVFYHCYR
jgi:glycosyl transferase family 2